ncbi:Protein kinase [uncultured virus]|nr:Protein kinase [uncultured virus]
MSNPSSINVTTNEVLKAYAAADAEIKDPVRGRNYLAGMDEQKRLEVAYLGDYKACPGTASVEAVAARLAALKPQQLQAEVKQHFTNADVMDAATCITSSFYADQGELALAGNERLREYLSGMSQIGAESVSGAALKTDLGENESNQPKAKSFYITKSPRDPNDADELVHEAFVALLALNNMRRPYGKSPAAPFFAWTYAMFNCSPPFLDAQKKVIAWCNSVKKGAVAYVVQENLADEKGQVDSLGKYARTCTAAQFMQKYLGSQMGQRAAYNRYGYTHYDRHGDNVLLPKRFNGRFYIPVETAQGLEYLECDDTIPTDIDFGMSHVQLETPDGRTLHFGHVSKKGPLIQFGVRRDVGSPMHDSYKLLCFCLLEMVTAKNMTAFDQLKGLLGFFNKSELPLDIIKKQNQTYYALPWSESIAALNLDDWITFCRNFCRQNGIPDPIKAQVPAGGSILSTGGDRITFTQALKTAGIDASSSQLPTPVDVLEFYDAFGTLASQAQAAKVDNDTAMATALTTAGNDLAARFREKFSEAYTKEQRKLELLSRDLTQIVAYQLPNNYADLLQPGVLRQIKQFVNQVVKYLDAYQRIALSVKAMQYIQRIYDLPATHQMSLLVKQYQDVLAKADKFKASLSNAIKNDLNFLEPWRGRASASDVAAVRAFIKTVNSEDEYEPYRWYWITYPTLLTMF